TLVHVAENCHEALAHDEDRAVFEVPEYIRKMVEKKFLGDKTKGGFYKRSASKEIEVFDPKTLAYRPKGGDKDIQAVTKSIAKIEDPKERVKKLVTDTGKVGEFARKVLYPSLAYAARRVAPGTGVSPETNVIADDLAAIDDAVKWGYSWELGPFE